MKDFSIILVNYNGMEYLPQCLDAIRKQKFKGSWEIIVVNNLSTDNSVEWLRQQKDVKLLDLGKNLGFSGGNNVGINEANGEFIVCLNFDCFLTPHFLQEVHDAFKTNSEIGMISGKLYKLVDFNPTQLLDTTGIEFIRCFPQDRGEWVVDNHQYDDKIEIFGPSGAAGCYRKLALDEVRFGNQEYFDEEMFIYVEDVDLSWRLNLAGWKGRYIPQAIAYHQRGSTRDKNPQEKKNYFVGGFGNRLYTMLKNLRWNQEIKPYWFNILKQEIRFYLNFSRMKPSNHLIYYLAFFRFLKLSFLPKTWDKRHFIQNNLKNPDFKLGFNEAMEEEEEEEEIIHYQNYNLLDTDLIDLSDFKQILEFNSESLKYSNIKKQSPDDGDLIKGITTSNDPQIHFLLHQCHNHNSSKFYISIGLFLDSESCGQFIYFDNNKNHSISDNIALKKGYHDYLFSIEQIPLSPIQTQFTWTAGCNRIRFDPSNQKNIALSIKYIKFFTKLK